MTNNAARCAIKSKAVLLLTWTNWVRLLISPKGFASSKKDDWTKAAEVIGFEQTAASELKLIYACYLLELEHSNKNLSKPTMT